MVFGSGALVLQLLGPPPDRPPARRDAASPPEPNAAEAASNARPEMATEKYQDVVAGLLSSGRVSDASAPEPSQVLSPAELADRGRVLRDANGAGNALPPASRDHSEPAAPVAPHEGPERPLVSADHSSAEPASSVAPPPNAAPPAAPLAAGLLPAPSSSPPHTPAPSSAESLPQPLPAALPVPAPQPPLSDAPTSSPAGASTAGAADRSPRITVRQAANLRTGPDVLANILRVVPRGETLRVHNRTANGWVQVGDAEPRGWLHISRLDEVE